MNSILLPEFFDTDRTLPDPVRPQAWQAHATFEQDPQHPSLRFRRVYPTRSIFSARVGGQSRALRIRDGDEIGWSWIGAHSNDDHLLSRIG